MGQGNAVRLVRFDDWPMRLSRFLKERQMMPHEFGKHDCLLFPADACNAITGVDFGKKWRGTYNDEAGAQLIVMKQWGGSISVPFYDFLGEPLPYPKKCQRGDVAVFDIGGKPTAGVIDDSGRRAACVSPDMGLIRIPVNETMIIWGIG